MKKKLICGVMAGMLALSTSLSSCSEKEIVDTGWGVIESIAHALRDRDFQRTAEEINADWGVHIPESACWKVSDYRENLFWNIWENYTVFSFEKEPTEFLADFSTEENEEFVSDFQYIAEYVSFADTDYKIDWMIDDTDWITDWMINWKQNYCWLELEISSFKDDNFPDRLYMVYCYQTAYLYVGEHFDRDPNF